VRAEGFQQLDFNVARARVMLSLLAMASLYVDPNTAGGLFRLSPLILTILLTHLVYSLATCFALSRGTAKPVLVGFSEALDLFFSGAVAFLTQAQTGPSFVFFVFAIVAVGVRPNPRPTVAVTTLSVVLYLLAIVLSDSISNLHLMSAVYLAIVGCLIGFVGQQRAVFEARIRDLETRAERESIARSLHDGYVQALAGVSLRLETCHQLLKRERSQDAMVQLTELQRGVTREYDQVRAYIRSLAGVAETSAGGPAASGDAPRLSIQAAFDTNARIAEHIIQIVLEGLRNACHHARATHVSIRVRQQDAQIVITIDDDGIGFGDSETAPWAIASRVAESGGQLRVGRDGSAHLEIEMTSESS